jgi:hypoxanthine-DNA glycosylase
MDRAEGFAPVYGAGSRVLILGSFPSVKSRAVGFYYGNPQNRFWRTVCGFFGEEVPCGVAEKKEFLFRRRIALWDVVTSCEIQGSADASIRGEEVADLGKVVAKSGVSRILCNGNKSYSVLEKNFPQLLPVTKKLSSTSPANPRFSAEEWYAALEEAFED